MSKPNVWGDENGDFYFAEGHVPPEEFKALCIAYDEECGIDSEEEGAAHMDTSRIVHYWVRVPLHVPDDEVDDYCDAPLERCGPNDERAEAWTVCPRE
jgi:hypothetical protein